uniref:Scaffold attachment factor B2 n=1 Tax=Molossus molossus TaxID=27622 RepID=A0A7J8ICE0_MOLMO|nr:scaffold attachment factor B2 [Molossus molossus]
MLHRWTSRYLRILKNHYWSQKMRKYSTFWGKLVNLSQ